MPPENNELDYSQLSDDDLFAQLGGEPSTPSIVEQSPLDRIGSLASSYGKGVVSGAVNLVPNAISGLGSALTYMSTHPIDRAFQDAAIAQQKGLTPAQYQLEKLTGYADIAGHTGAQVGGGLLGALGGTATFGPGAGTYVGAGLGAGAGETLYQTLKDYILGNEPKTPEELAKGAGEAFVGGALTPVGASPAKRAAVLEAPSQVVSGVQQRLVTSPQQALADVGEATRTIWPTEQLQTAAKTAKTDPLGGAYTTAELIPNKEAVLLERAAAAQDPLLNAKIADLKSKTTEGEKFLLEQEYSNLLESPESLGKYGIGELKKIEIQKGIEKIDQQVKDLYAPIDKKYTIKKFGSLKNAVQDAGDLFGGAKLVPGDIKSLIETITDTPVKEGFTVGRLIKLRSTAGDIQRKYKNEIGGRTGLKAATAIKNALTQLIEKTPTGADDWAAANEAARPLLSLRDEGPLGGVTLGGATPEQIFAKIGKDVSSIKQYKTLTNESPEAMAALQAGIINELSGKTPAQRVNYITRNKAKITEAFNGKTETFDAMVRKQKANARIAASVVPYGGSQTQALQSLAEASPNISVLLNSLRPSSRLSALENVPYLSQLVKPVRTIEDIYKTVTNPRAAVQMKKLQEALLNPLVAQEARKLADQRQSKLSQSLTKKD